MAPLSEREISTVALANLYSMLDTMSVYILDYNNCFFYYPWPKYLDEEQHKWMDDYDFMVTEVLKKH
jgi:hypothetical protein